MKLRIVGKIILVLLFTLVPTLAHAKSDAPPPVNAPVVREGDFAVKLANALGVSKSADEIEAESQLGDIGIAPRNGWIADYPVTPDVIGELQESVSSAAESKKISLSKEQATEAFAGVKIATGLALRPATAAAEGGAGSAQPQPSAPKEYPNTTVVNNYYYNEGPPIVTYYEPPPAFTYLYVWVPFPFWWYGGWYPGFFVLHDFHRVVIMNGHAMRISNHYNAVNVHHMYRIDPESRWHGRTYAGIGAPRSHNYVSTGVRHSEHQIFNGPHGNEHGGPAAGQGSHERTPNYGGGHGQVGGHGGFGGSHGGSGGGHGGSHDMRGGLRMGHGGGGRDD